MREPRRVKCLSHGFLVICVLICLSNIELPFAGKVFLVCVSPAPSTDSYVSNSSGKYMIFFCFHEMKTQYLQQEQQKIKLFRYLCFLQMKKNIYIYIISKKSIIQSKPLGSRQVPVSAWPLFNLTVISVIHTQNSESSSLCEAYYKAQQSLSCHPTQSLLSRVPL